MQEPAPQHGHNRLDFIQALRGLAAFGVVLFHAKIVMPTAGQAALFEWGAAGVDLFFVVSGFIMVHATARSDGSLRYALEFLSKRLARIWPVYMIWMVLYIVTVERVPHVWSSLARSAVFYPSALRPPPMFGGTPNSVGWTINYEVWFYVLFAISLVAKRWRWLTFASLVAAFTIVIPLVLTGDVHTAAGQEYRLPTAILRLAANPMTWDFAAGVAIGLIYRSRFHLRHDGVLKVFVILAVTVEVWCLGTGFRAGYGPAAWGTPIIVMVLALALWDKQHPIAVPRWLIWLGDVSFSLYLLHRIPLLVGYFHLPSPLPGGFPYLFAVIVVSLLLAELSARYLERGLSEWVRVRLVRGVHRLTA
ncbi:MAG TPA: acyltransferase [Kofleriaceae bacterium]|nr:acyltransferase [Kofleriaceae bacterium]